MHTPRRAQCGLTLIEMIIFMVIVGVALAGIVSVLGNALRGGADMVSHKQALAIAEAIVEEIALKPFTYCDPDDPAAATATGTGSCTTPAQDHEGVNRPDFDNVIDYARIPSLPDPVWDHTGTWRFPSGFSVTSLTVASEGLGGIGSAESLRISVTVTGPGNSTVTLDTYRTRHAPNFTH